MFKLQQQCSTYQDDFQEGCHIIQVSNIDITFYEGLEWGGTENR